MASLLFSAAAKMLLGLFLMFSPLFGCAGTLRYPNAWLMLAILLIPMAAMGIVLAAKAPKLLEKRINMREKERSQMWVVALSGILILLMFALAGLDFRFGWSQLPKLCVFMAAALFLLGYALYAEVLRENAWLSRTVEIQQGQKLVDTGLYAVVRHPMYAAVVLIFLSMPLVLGSLPAFLLMLPYPILLAMRIHEEENMLTHGLEGYAEYKQRVRWRMIPFIW